MAKRGKNKEAVAIARDVIAQIDTHRYIARTGSYVCREDCKNFAPGDLQSQILQDDRKKKPCTVCALGSAFISAVRLYDQFKVKPNMEYNFETGDYDLPSKDGEDINDRETLVPILGKFFTTVELGRIEALFENDSAFLDERNGGGRVDSLFEDFHMITSGLASEARLRLIMQEIVRQEGRLDPRRANAQARRIIKRQMELESMGHLELATKELYDDAR